MFFAGLKLTLPAVMRNHRRQSVGACDQAFIKQRPATIMRFARAGDGRSRTLGPLTMCGIAGVWFADRAHAVDEAVLAAMADAIAHRGPDGAGLHLRPGFGFAHRRLSIVDIASGKQPMATEDGELVVAFNGEIYNYLDLRAELEREGHRFRTNSDTEVLLAGIALLWGLFELFSALRPVRGDQRPWESIDTGAAGAALLAVSSPLIFTMTTRPMSDVVGLAFGVAAQACLARAWWWQTPPADGDRRLTAVQIEASGGLIVRGAFLAGLAIGVRTQTLWLTAPLLVLVLADRIGRGAAGALLGAIMTSALGSLLWAVPMVVATGGLGEYLDVLGMQAGEDFSSGEMLFTSGSLRGLAQGLVHTFIDPWNHPALGAAVLALAIVGGLALLRHDRRTFVLLSAVSLPYLVFHLLFQETPFIRYAMPLVPVMAYLAMRGLQLMAPRAVPPVSAVLVAACLLMAVPLSMRAAEAPGVAVQVLGAMREAAASTPPAALAMHQAFRRPLEAEAVPVRPVLPSPPRREWLELVGHWREGGQGPLWFLADPRRSDLALIDQRSLRVRHEYSWAPTGARVFSGVRPNAVQWVEMQPPRWIAETGWALTPETAGMAQLMNAGPHLAPIVAQVRRGPEALRMLVGGRHLGAAGDPPVTFTVSIDEAIVDEFTVPPGFFLRTVMLPAVAVAPGGPESGRDGPYAPLQIASAPVSGTQPVATAIEQFDLQTPDTLPMAPGRIRAGHATSAGRTR